MKWLSWEDGRQGTGYKKMLLLASPFFFKFDTYLIYYPVGTKIPPHTDKVEGKKHYRLNMILFPFKKDNCFKSENVIFSFLNINFFRPDICVHEVLEVKEKSRIVFSFGFVL